MFLTFIWIVVNMIYWPFLIVTFTISADFSVQHVSHSAAYRIAAASATTQHRHDLWSRAAVEFARTIKCESMFPGAQAQCEQMHDVPTNHVNLYIAEDRPGTKLVAVLPDGSLAESGQHDAVLALDPFPHASFGHLVLVFFVQHFVDHSFCGRNGGTYLSEIGDCLILALRHSRFNQDDVHRHSPKFKSRHLVATQRGSEIDFLPSVFKAAITTETNLGMIRKQQLLRCIETVAGFYPCAKLRPENRAFEVMCDGKTRSIEDCERHFHDRSSLRCRLFETCDHAVILSTGWNQLTTRSSYDQVSLTNSYKMLRNSGFPSGNIKAFYANGVLDNESTPIPRLYPATMKSAIRSQVQQTCRSSRCVDSFVLLLSGPALNNGDLLLFDKDQNGLADAEELYSVKELVDDLSNCGAKQAIVLADFSYSGALVNQLRGSTEHRNVLVFASGGALDFSWSSEFTSHWMHSMDRADCVKSVFQCANLEHVFHSKPVPNHNGYKVSDSIHKNQTPHIENKASKRLTTHSTASMFDGSKESLRTTLYGAPCDVFPPFSEQELKELFFGCQNVPTSEWFRSFDSPKIYESQSSEEVHNSDSDLFDAADTSESFTSADSLRKLRKRKS